MSDVQNEQHRLAQQSLNYFLQTHLAAFNINSVDDILLEYIINVINVDFHQRYNEQDELDEFCEMLEGYIPGFNSIDRLLVQNWIVELSSLLGKGTGSSTLSCVELHSNLPDNSVKSPEQISKECDDKKPEPTAYKSEQQKDLNEIIIDECCESSSSDNNHDHDVLSELFPSACNLEIRHCLELSNGDVDKAVQLMLHRQDVGESIQLTGHRQQVSVSRTLESGSIVDDKKLKDNIIAKYSYVDSSDDVKEHRPVVPKAEPKKMIRYRENKIVSLKGERFTDVKKDETDDMKKTYINLKPAKQYRFH
ncbi:CUEDC2 (predicted) [Pycnogonum litorale]